MAIKASATITLSFMVDVKAVYRYYKLQASTASAPSVPTAYPPSGWTDSEPSYTTGSTNTLYFVDCTVFTNNTFSYSAVSKSSSYEAAKEAFNKAVAAGNTANSANNKIDNLQIGGRNLTRDSKEVKIWYCAYGTNKVHSVKRNGNTYTVNGRSINNPYEVSFVSGGSGDMRFGTIMVNDDATEYKYDLSYKTYTMSVWVMSDTDVTISSYVTRQYNDSDGSGKVHILTANKWIKITHSRTFNNRSDLDGVRVRFTCGSTCKIVFCLGKVELGDKATDWTPAPEDVDYAINAKIASVDVEYYLSTSATSLSGGSWSSIAPTWVNGKYMWSRTKTVKGDGTVSYKPSETGTCIAGAKGDTGATGATGTGISSIAEEYYLSTSKTERTGGSWTTTPPTWSSGKYIWTRSKIVYTNPASTAYTTPICDSSWEAVNEIEVGGRNLARNTAVSKTHTVTTASGDSSWNVCNSYWKHGIVLEPGQTYTLSFDYSFDWGTVTKPTGAADIGPGIGSNFANKNYIAYNHDTFTAIADYWIYGSGKYDSGKFVYTLTNPDTSNIYFAFRMVRSNSLSIIGVTITISNFKLEKGNKPTDWTPAPEDVDSKIEEAAKTATSYIYYDSTNGLQIGDKSSGSWSGTRAQIKSNAYNLLDQSGTQLASFGATATIGKTSGNNVYIDSDSVDIRNKTSTLASFGASTVGSHGYTKLECDGNLDITSALSPSEGVSKRGGVIITDGTAGTAVWSDFASTKWSELSTSTWNDLNGSGWEKARGKYFETTLYASETDETTTNKSISSTVSITTNRETYSDGTKLVSTMNLIASRIHLSPSMSLTYDIPVIVSGDCNQLVKSGKYYLGNEVTHRPVVVNGWLEVMRYEPYHCFQRFTTYTGRTYERNMINGSWTSWGRQMQQVILFDNDSNGFSSSVTLSESAANFDKMTLIYTTNDGSYASSEVWKPNGKKVALTTSIVASDSNLYLKSKVVYINGTSITTATSGSVNSTGNAAVNGSNNVNKVDCVAITQVIGWR